MHKSKEIIIYLCYGIMFFFCTYIVLRMFTEMVLIQRLGMNNSFTKVVLCQWEQKEDEVDNSQVVSNQIIIDWKALFPFEEENTSEMMEKVQEPSVEEAPGLLDKWQNKILSYESILEDYTTDKVIGYNFFIEALNKYEALISWNISSYLEYNSVVNLGDGYYVEFTQQMDVSENIEQTVMLNEYCESLGIDFMYVQAPGKISKYDDSNISGTLDFANQNTDLLIQGLQDNNVEFLDLREEIEKEDFVYRDLFYNSDHHWKAETGLWAAGKVAKILNAEYNYSLDDSLLEKELFSSVIYEDCFLGSSGKKVTLSKSKPDDIVLLYPTYEVNLHYEIPSKEFDGEGDFSIVYDMSQIERIDYYNLDPYLAYNRGENTLIKIHNNLISNGKKILIIKDSYVNVVAPFLALVMEDVELLDLRGAFQGSVLKYIKECKPDMVMVFYSTYSVKEIDWRYHTATFDFR